MNNSKVEIKWPNGKFSYVQAGENWLDAAIKAGVSIPTGCLGGSCGACEIEINGEVVRACISNISEKSHNPIKVDFASDPYW